MSKLKIRFFTVADYREEEDWLRRQSQQGLQLHRFLPPCFFLFEEGRPEDTVYRLDYKNTAPEEEYLALCRDCGWEYSGSFLGWHYFRKPAGQIREENEGQLFSDADSRLEMIRHILRTRMLPLLLLLLFCLIPNWGMALGGTLGGAGTFFAVVFTVLIVLYVFLILHCGRKLLRLQRENEEGRG